MVVLHSLGNLIRQNANVAGNLGGVPLFAGAGTDIQNWVGGLVPTTKLATLVA